MNLLLSRDIKKKKNFCYAVEIIVKTGSCKDIVKKIDVVLLYPK